MVAIESTQRMMGRVLDPPQHAAAAFSHHQLLYEEGAFEWSKGMLPPMAWYAAVIETWEAEHRHTNQSGHVPAPGQQQSGPPPASNAECLAAGGFMSGLAWTTQQPHRTDAAAEVRLLVVVDSGGAWYKANGDRHLLEELLRAVGITNIIFEVIHGGTPKHYASMAAW